MFVLSYICRLFIFDQNRHQVETVNCSTSEPPIVYGPITRELFSVFDRFRGECGELDPADVVRTLHVIDLFPLKSQIRHLLESVKQCHASENKRKTSLTFGVFCVLVKELRECQYTVKSHKMGCVHGRQTHVNPNVQRTKTKSSCHLNGAAKSPLILNFDVFLGGACNPTTWRKDVAIPILKQYGITFYNPQVHEWSSELIEIEEQAKQSAKLLLFVLDEKTRGIASMVEAAFLSGVGRTLFVVIQGVPLTGDDLEGEVITESEFEDLERGQAFLCDLVERQGFPVFDDIPTALQCVNKVLKQGVQVEDLTLSDGAQVVNQKHAHCRPGDRLIALKETFQMYDQDKNGHLHVEDLFLAVKTATGRDDLTPSDFDCIQKKCNCSIKEHENIPSVNSLTFDEFCCLVTEYSHVWPSKHGRGCLAYYLKGLQESSRDLCNWFFSWRFNDDVNEVVSLMKRDIFLGGSCSSSRWREDIAIPLLRKNGITFFNPRTEHWTIRFIPLEHEAKEHCICLLYVITSATRSVGSMVEAAHYIGQGRTVVLCIQEIHEESLIEGERLSKRALRDYNRGRKYLEDVANRSKVPIFNDVLESVQCAVQLMKSEKCS